MYTTPTLVIVRISFVSIGVHMQKRKKETVWSRLWRYLAGLVGIDTTKKAFYKSRHRKEK